MWRSYLMGVRVVYWSHYPTVDSDTKYAVQDGQDGTVQFELDWYY